MIGISTDIAAERAHFQIEKLIYGTTGFAKNGDVQIWYEHRLPKGTPKGTIVFVMGIATDSLAWHNVFLEQFINDGFAVVRFDNRDVGMSSWISDFKNNRYTLTDMANDAWAVVDALNIEKPHLCGISMGGMIAQAMTIQQPTRVISLINIMSSGYVLDPLRLAPRSGWTLFRFIKSIMEVRRNFSEQNLLQLQFTILRILMGDRCKDGIANQTIINNFIASYYHRKKYNPNASAQQFHAIRVGGSRYKALQKLTLPSLIIHGTVDPLVPFSHSQQLKKLMPHSETLWVEGMGHAISPAFVELVGNKMITFLNQIK